MSSLPSWSSERKEYSRSSGRAASGAAGSAGPGNRALEAGRSAGWAAFFMPP